MSHFFVRRTYLRVTDCTTGDLIRFHLNLSVIFRNDFIHLITSFGKPIQKAPALTAMLIPLFSFITLLLRDSLSDCSKMRCCRYFLRRSVPKKTPCSCLSLGMFFSHNRMKLLIKSNEEGLSRCNLLRWRLF